MKSYFEYVIWGIPADQTEEVLLVSKVDNKVLTDRKEAERWAKVCIEKYKCKNVRIQQVNLSDNKISFNH